MPYLYKIAHKIWNIAKLIWVVIIVSLAVSLLVFLVVIPSNDYPHAFSQSIFSWLFLPGLNRALTLSLLISLMFITFSAWIITLVGNYKKYGIGLRQYATSHRVIHQYLRVVVKNNSDIYLKCFSEETRGFLAKSILISLNRVFTQQRTISDLSLGDAVSIKQHLNEKVSQLAALEGNKYEELIQELDNTWYFQLEQQLANNQQQTVSSIEKILQQLKPESPVAIILGKPGSGKSVTLRWLALQMAQGFPARRHRLSKDLSPRQIPILLSISKYAKHLNTAVNLPFTQFFIDECAELYPQLPTLPNALFYELERGRCLVLIDGLDEVANDNLRRTVEDRVHSFISRYIGLMPPSRHYNRFVCTSRIVGYDPKPFARYAHYGLLDFDGKQIERFVTNWFSERYKGINTQETQPSTALQRIAIKATGTQRRDHLISLIQRDESIRRLATNPLMLTMLAIIEDSGQDIPRNRIGLYQTIVHAYLSSWSYEHGQAFLSEKDTQLLEKILSNMASRLYNDSPALTLSDIYTISKQTLIEAKNYLSKEPDDQDIRHLVNIISDSGLLLENNGLFSFRHRSFQEYFAALYLLHMPAEKLYSFVEEYYRSAVWHEPLLFAIAHEGESAQWKYIEEEGKAMSVIKALAKTSEAHKSVSAAYHLYSDSNQTADDRATVLSALKQALQLNKEEVDEILLACTDKRQLSKDKQKELGVITVQGAAWDLLTQQFTLESDALASLIKALATNDEIKCAAAALLLQHSKNLRQLERKKAAQVISKKLDNDRLSDHPLDTPNYGTTWWLEDILFKTLKTLAR